MKDRLKGLFAADPAAEVVLAEHQADPDTYELPLRKKLDTIGVGQLDADDPVVAAQRLLALTDPAGSQAGRYAIGFMSASSVGWWAAA